MKIIRLYDPKTFEGLVRIGDRTFNVDNQKEEILDCLKTSTFFTNDENSLEPMNASDAEDYIFNRANFYTNNKREKLVI